VLVSIRLLRTNSRSSAELHRQLTRRTELHVASIQDERLPKATPLREPHSSQEVSRSTSWQPTVHYRIHKRPPLVSTVGQSNPIHDSQSHFMKIHFNIIIPPIPRSYNLSPSVRFPNQTL